MHPVFTILLFIATAIAEIIGCYLPYLWLRKGAAWWLLIPAVCSLAVFVWLLSLHPTAAGRTYAAYAGVYMLTGLAWLRLVESVKPDRWDLAGAFIMLVGAMVVYFGPRG